MLIALTGRLALLAGLCLATPALAAEPPLPAPLAFISLEDEARHLDMLDPESAALRRVARIGVTDSQETNLIGQLQWSPDGRQLLFIAYEGGDGELMLVQADGSGLRQLSDNLDDESQPRWSPDGKQIAYVLKTKSEQGSSQLRVLDLASGESRGLSGGSWGPDWSPDGREIVFLSYDKSQMDIFTITPDGERLRRLTRDEADSNEPFWAPDGRHLVYAKCRSQLCRLYLINPDGSGEQALTPEDETVSRFGAQWSPDGSELVYTAMDSEGHSWLELVKADGSGLRKLYEAPGVSFGAVWSPDGRSLAFQTQAAEPESVMQLVVIDREGKAARPLSLADKPVLGFWPSWRPVNP